VRGDAAHAGHPFTDLGNVLRFDRGPAYADAVLAAWCDRRGRTPAEALETARAADLWALVDLAAGAVRTRSRIERTSTSRPSLGAETCTRCRSACPTRTLLP
jgi:hypothetical protein